MKPIRSLLQRAASRPVERVRSGIRRWFLRKPFGLRAKIAFLIVPNVVGVLFLFSYLDFHFARKDQIDLYSDRNLYIAKQIDLGIPDPRNANNLRHIREEMEEWLLSRPSLMEIDLFVFTPTSAVQTVVSTSKLSDHHTEVILTEDEIKRVRRDKSVSVVREVGDEHLIEVIVPNHSGKKVIGGIRVASSLDEARSYLSRKKERAIVLTFSSILIILIALSLFFRKLVGSPIQKLVEAMSRAERGDLEAEARIQSRDELGELGRNFNQMLKTIRETHEQNVHLLAQVSRFNEELTQKIEAATSELAKRYDELELLNEALFESQRQLSQSEKLAALGQVAATMAHQIGTPLNSISGYLQLMLQDGNLRPRDRERLLTIESQLDRLTDSVKNLLSFTRQPKPQLKSLDINGVLEELIHLSEPWLLAKNVRSTASLHPGLPSVLGDATHLQALFLNLMTNALDAMPQGGTLTIQTAQVQDQRPAADQAWVEVTLSDTGIGITEESKKRIFDPFFTTKKIGEGTGLGLAICNQIIKDHAGKMEFESVVGKGSTFRVFIPVQKREEPLEP
jgi:two-component system, NtrC family, sensor kinase